MKKILSIIIMIFLNITFIFFSQLSLATRINLTSLAKAPIEIDINLDCTLDSFIEESFKRLRENGCMKKEGEYELRCYYNDGKGVAYRSHIFVSSLPSEDGFTHSNVSVNDWLKPYFAINPENAKEPITLYFILNNLKDYAEKNLKTP